MGDEKSSRKIETERVNLLGVWKLVQKTLVQDKIPRGHKEVIEVSCKKSGKDIL